MMTEIPNLASYLGTPMVDPEGERIGRIDEFYLDDRTGRPAWALVHTGLFGTRSSFVPLAGAVAREDRLEVPFDKATVKDAPGIQADGHLSVDEERELYRHYGMDYDTMPSRGEAGEVTERLAGAEPEQSETRQPAGEAMTLSEEQLSVETQRRPATRARLRKYSVTEEVTLKVPVTREEVRVEYEPVGEAEAARVDRMAEPEDAEDTGDVVLHREVPIIDRQRVPTERVHLATETVSEEQEITAQKRREELDVQREDRGG